MCNSILLSTGIESNGPDSGELLVEVVKALVIDTFDIIINIFLYYVKLVGIISFINKKSQDFLFLFQKSNHSR